MARLKVGASITNYNEVTELIINLINQTNKFNAEFIVNIANNYIQGSNLDITEKEMSRRVHTVLDVMQLYECIVYSNGEYTVVSKDFSIVEYNKHNNRSDIML